MVKLWTRKLLNPERCKFVLFFRTVQICSEFHPAPYRTGIKVLSLVYDVNLIFHLVPRIRMSG